MQNVKISVDKKGIMTIVIDTTKELGWSKSGKTITIASTKGNKEVAPGIILGLNSYKFPE